MNEKVCRRLVSERSEGLCERCCFGGALSMHHRLKRGQGGLWTPENIVHVCGNGVVGCHSWAEFNPNAAAELGFHVRPWMDPALTPIKYRLSHWVLLTPEGGFEDADE